MSKLGLAMLGMGAPPVGGLMPGGGNSKASGGADGDNPGQKGPKAVGSRVAQHLSAAAKAHASGNHRGFQGSLFSALSESRRAAPSGNHGSDVPGSQYNATEANAHQSGNHEGLGDGAPAYKGPKGLSQNGSGNRGDAVKGSLPKTSFPKTKNKKGSLGTGVQGHSLPPGGGSWLTGGTPAGNPQPNEVTSGIGSGGA